MRPSEYIVAAQFSAKVAVDNCRRLPSESPSSLMDFQHAFTLVCSLKLSIDLVVVQDRYSDYVEYHASAGCFIPN